MQISHTGRQPGSAPTAFPFVLWQTEGSRMCPPAARTWDGKELSTLLLPVSTEHSSLLHLEPTWQQQTVMELNHCFCLKNASAVYKFKYSWHLQLTHINHNTATGVRQVWSLCWEVISQKKFNFYLIIMVFSLMYSIVKEKPLSLELIILFWLSEETLNKMFDSFK